MSFVKNDSAGYLINHMARLFAQELTARIKPLGLTTGTFPALLELWDQDGLTQKQLVTRTRLLPLPPALLPQMPPASA